MLLVENQLLESSMSVAWACASLLHFPPRKWGEVVWAEHVKSSAVPPGHAHCLVRQRATAHPTSTSTGEETAPARLQHMAGEAVPAVAPTMVVHPTGSCAGEVGELLGLGTQAKFRELKPLGRFWHSSQASVTQRRQRLLHWEDYIQVLLLRGASKEP